MYILATSLPQTQCPKLNGTFKKQCLTISETLETIGGPQNTKLFLDQAMLTLRSSRAQPRCDPSVSSKLLKDWQIKLEKELDVHSLKYEYASLYGRLVNEWLSASEDGSDTSSSDGAGFETIGRKEMHDQRAKWEEYVFKACETDRPAIDEYLVKLFYSNKETETAYERNYAMKLPNLRTNGLALSILMRHR